MPKSAFAQTKTKKALPKTTLILIIVLGVLIVGGVAAYFLIFNKSATPAPAPQQQQTQPVTPDEPEEPEEEPETEPEEEPEAEPEEEPEVETDAEEKPTTAQ